MGCLMSVLALVGASTAGELAAPAAKSPLVPARLAIYYGYPGQVNGAAGDPMIAARVFEAYDVVVFGDGLEFADVDPARRPKGAGPEEHERTRTIIRRLQQGPRRTAVYGYVDLGNSQNLSLAELHRRIELWAAMGVQGIFFDEAGFDFGVTRARQNAVVQRVHALGLRAFMNAFEPDDLFATKVVALNPLGGGNPMGARPSLGPSDLFLLESFQVRLGVFAEADGSIARIGRALAHRDRFGSRILAVTTTARPEHYRPEAFRYAWWSAVLWALDGFGWGEPSFSASTSELPWRMRAEEDSAIGRRFTSRAAKTANRYSRRTDAGTVMLDTVTHTGRFVSNSSAP